MESIKSNLSINFKTGLDELCNCYNNKIGILEKKIENQNTTIEHLQTRISSIEQQHDILKEDFEQYKSVSIVKNLNKQISEKDYEISFLNTRINKLKTVIVNSSENEAEKVSSDTSSENEEEVSSKNEEVEKVSEDTSSENEEEEEVSSKNEEVSSDEEVETTFIEKKLKGKIFFVSEDEDRDIYIKLPDGELGEIVGKYNSNNRPIFFKTK